MLNEDTYSIDRPRVITIMAEPGSPLTQIFVDPDYLFYRNLIYPKIIRSELIINKNSKSGNYIIFLN